MKDPSRTSAWHGSHNFEDHTGEVRVRLRAKSMPELFAEAGRALAELYAGSVAIPAGKRTREEVRLRSSDRDALLVAWLNELIFRSEMRRMIFTDFDLHDLSSTELTASVRGAEAPDLRSLVKAATMHGLEITEDARGLSAVVVLDV